MHLSILSDTFLSDRMDDGGPNAERGAAGAHWDGVLRGAACLAIVAALVALALLSNLADPAARSNAGPAARAAVATMPALEDETAIVGRLILSHD